MRTIKDFFITIIFTTIFCSILGIIGFSVVSTIPIAFILFNTDFIMFVAYIFQVLFQIISFCILIYLLDM